MTNNYKSVLFSAAAAGAGTVPHNFKLPHPSVQTSEMLREATRMSAAQQAMPPMMMTSGRPSTGKDDGMVTRSKSRMLRK